MESRPWFLNNLCNQNKTIYFVIDGKAKSYRKEQLMLYFLTATYTKILNFNTNQKFKLNYSDI